MERYIERQRKKGVREKKQNKYCLSMFCAVYMMDNCFILIFGITLILNMNNLYSTGIYIELSTSHSL